MPTLNHLADTNNAAGEYDLGLAFEVQHKLTQIFKYSNIQIFLFFLFAVAAAAAAAAAASGVHGLTAEQQRAMQMGRPIIRQKTKVCLP